MDSFGTKQPSEAFFVAFDFTNDLVTDTISSAIVAATRVDTGAVVTSTLTDSTKQTIAGALVYVWVQAGTLGVQYKITCDVTTVLGAVYELDGLITVLEDPTLSAGGLVTAPATEPITLAELKSHLRLDSETTAGNLDSTQSIPPGLYEPRELMTLDVAPGGAGWAAGDTITGQASTRTCVVVERLTTKTYIVKSRSGAYTLGEILSNGTATADQGAAHPTFAAYYSPVGTGVEVLGTDALVQFASGTCGATGTVDVKIQDSDDNVTYVDWVGGAFTQVSTANDNATFEKAYTGSKRWIRAVAKTQLASCSYGVDIVRNAATLAEDDLLEDIITAAREHIEDITWRALITQTWDMVLQDFPRGNSITIPRGNLQNVISMTYKDSDGTVTTMAEGTDYLVVTNGEQCGKVVLPYGCSWPSATLYPSNPICIRYRCGWTSASAVPRKIKTAVKMIAADMYEGRGEAVIGQTVVENKTVARLLGSARLWDGI